MYEQMKNASGFGENNKGSQSLPSQKTRISAHLVRFHGSCPVYGCETLSGMSFFAGLKTPGPEPEYDRTYARVMPCLFYVRSARYLEGYGGARRTKNSIR
jgi:hypothetical protein